MVAHRLRLNWYKFNGYIVYWYIQHGYKLNRHIFNWHKLNWYIVYWHFKQQW